VKVFIDNLFRWLEQKSLYVYNQRRKVITCRFLRRDILSDSLSASLQDYLESIYELRETLGVVRVTDLAQKLNLSKASVSQAVSQLSEKGLVTQELYGPIELTLEGEIEAKKVIETHQKIYLFLTEVLGVDQKTADQDACLIEHVVSETTMEKLCEFMSEYTKEK
jgi:DtxR family Mn-dependent transcriptional regulator